MSSTNKTANYELSQYIGSDKPTYLVDYNGDMLKIDTGMAANKAQADATDLVVSGHTSAIEGLQGTTSDQGTAITGLRTDVDGNTGSINTINSLIGNGEPTTTDKTIIGAINEINANESTLAGNVSTLTTEVAGKQATLTDISSLVAITTDNADITITDQSCRKYGKIVMIEGVINIANDITDGTTIMNVSSDYVPAGNVFSSSSEPSGNSIELALTPTGLINAWGAVEASSNVPFSFMFIIA